jgi:hypothetical protein
VKVGKFIFHAFAPVTVVGIDDPESLLIDKFFILLAHLESELTRSIASIGSTFDALRL